MDKLMPNLVVGIDPELHRKLKIKSASEGKTIKQLIDSMLRKELK